MSNGSNEHDVLPLEQFLALPEALRVNQRCAQCGVLYRELDNIGRHKCYTHPGRVQMGRLHPGEPTRQFYTCCHYPVRGDRRLPSEPDLLFIGCTPCDHRPMSDLDAFVPLSNHIIAMGVRRPPDGQIARVYSEETIRALSPGTPTQLETVNGPIDIPDELAMVKEIQRELLEDEASHDIIREKLRNDPELQEQAQLHERINTIWPEAYLVDNGSGAVDLSQRSADHFLEQRIFNVQHGDNQHNVILPFLMVRRHALERSGTRTQFVQGYLDELAGRHDAVVEYI